MLVVRCTIGFALLMAWCWLILRGYGEPWPFLFNDEFGGLFGVLPSATIFLYLLALGQKRISGDSVFPRIWFFGCWALCCPVLMDMLPVQFTAGSTDIVVNVVAGFGLATGCLMVALETAALSRLGILLTACLGVLASVVFIEMILLVRPDAIFLLPVVIALLLKILFPATKVEVQENTHASTPVMDVRAQTPRLGLLVPILALTGFSYGLYYSLMAVLEPLLPQPRHAMLPLVCFGCLLSGICIYSACKSLLGRIVLLMWPILVVGYTAWPLLHRESPALSLGSLHLAYIFLAILTLIAIFYACTRHSSRNNELLCAGSACAALFLGILLGACTLPGIRSSFSHGVAVNYIFALLSITILVSCWIYVFILGKMNFWRPVHEHNRQMLSVDGDGAVWGNEQYAGVKDDMDSEDFERIFKELGLTRQQALVASLIACKKQDDDICLSLSIAPNTLKTHIRNILKKLGINSRHELLWMATSFNRGRSFRE